MLSGCEIWNFVDQAQVGSGKDGMGFVEFVNEHFECTVATIAVETEEAHPEDCMVGVGQNICIGCHDSRQQFSGVGLFPLHLCERRNHAGFSTVGDHADDVEQQPLLGRNHVEFVVVVQVGGKNMRRQVCAGRPAAVRTTQTTGGTLSLHGSSALQ